MQHISKALLSILALLTSGCATLSEQDRSDLAEKTPFCFDDAQCEAQWSSARDWVQANAGFKFQIYSNDLIEAYNPPQHDPRIAARVTKSLYKSAADEKIYAITVDLWCANIIGCQPSLKEAYESFYRTVTPADDTSFACMAQQTASAIPRFGLSYVTLTSKAGIKVKRVCANSPAKSGGLLVNDLITKVQGNSISDERFWEQLIASGSLKPGQSVPVTVERDGQTISLSMALPTQMDMDEIARRIPQVAGDIAKSRAPDSSSGRLRQLKEALDAGLIDRNDYETTKQRILSEI